MIQCNRCGGILPHFANHDSQLKACDCEATSVGETPELPNSEGAFPVATGSALRESMDAARNTVAYWKEAYDMEHEENQRLRKKLRETKKYLRAANKGARILSLAFQLSVANRVIAQLKSSQNA